MFGYFSYENKMTLFYILCVLTSLYLIYFVYKYVLKVLSDLKWYKKQGVEIIGFFHCLETLEHSKMI